ncbi:MAG: SagB/ThcOx family dehydrogenase [Bacillota bacterium]
MTNGRPPADPARPDRRVELPPARTSDGPGLWEALRTRRSVRKYLRLSLGLQDLSQLLWAAQGLTSSRGPRGLRTAPSAGACYPIDTYVAVGEVADLEPGLWRYEVDGHGLELTRPGDLRADLARAALGQTFLAICPAVFCFTLVLERTAARYGERAFRYACLDCGHLAQNLALAAAGLGYGTCMVGAFDDTAVAEVLGLDPTDPREVPLYLIPVGRPA